MNFDKFKRFRDQLFAEEQAAERKLAAVAHPSRLPFLTAEARRRAELISETVLRTPWPGPGTTSLAAGLQSVTADVIAGRLR